MGNMGLELGTVKIQGDLSYIYEYLIERYEKEEARLFSVPLTEQKTNSTN